MHATARRINVVNRSDRQLDRERCALAHTFADRANSSAMKFHQVTHDRETQSHAAMLTAGFLVGLTEAIENMW
jgi:hypothetical protein